MRLISLCPLAVLCFAAMGLPVNSAEPTEFSVMTWNLEWFFDNQTADNPSELGREKSAPSREQWDWRRDRVAAAIAKVQPTIVALQEVESQNVMYFLTRAIDRNHNLKYDDYVIKGDDFYTEQDVALLATKTTGVQSISRGVVTPAMKSRGYASVSKHLFAVVEIPVNGKVELLVIANCHLRAMAEKGELRARQARTLSLWLERLVKGVKASQEDPGQAVHVLVTGDFNTEELAGQIAADSDLGVLMSRGTDDPSDDLIDLHNHIPPGERTTHLLPGRQFDRILVSRDLVIDTPGVVDLSLRDVTVRTDLNFGGDQDPQAEHWDNYWNIPDDQRDISDHNPVLARFQIQ
ncbi:endonuclease/exonuclease/phosphatase family protein [Rhodopirellula sp. P2]|uniref:endonuclease/exonuclease/phosphatase family protein n=1 Tax=Rhodopirellula sp. P2 TaxID=2127060 RepID=UPI002368936B|nr:endonuclease/exonuclease/phosphatase family protein [Rhodopirellula sp. P2]WDQ15671.1 endonuclease/exonuclease/phosphatase family protein [Rhodopirellula sp. P2]